MTAGPVSGSGRGNVYPNYGLPVTPSSPSGRPAMDLSMRAATVDRERAIDVLRAGFAEGRLTKEEHDERVSKVYDSRTYGDLAALTSDLPAGPMPFAPVAAQPQHVVAAAPRTNAMAVASLICGFFVGFGTIPAIILGHAARAQIRRTGEGGDGLAVGGLILGWGAIALFATFFMLVSVAIARQGVAPGGVHTIPVIINGRGNG